MPVNNEVRHKIGKSVKNRYICIYQYNVVTLTISQIEKISKALGDINRLRILYYLSDKGGCGECSGLQEVVDLAHPSISHHVKILAEAGLIEGEKEGRNYRYTLNSSLLSDYIGILEDMKCETLTDGKN
jgi:ArsR family transcriptional regulator